MAVWLVLRRQTPGLLSVLLRAVPGWSIQNQQQQVSAVFRACKSQNFNGAWARFMWHGLCVWAAATSHPSQEQAMPRPNAMNHRSTTRGQAIRRNGTQRRTSSGRQTKSKRTSQPAYLPTRREIARRCREIQATWTPATRRLRDLYRIEPLALVPVHGRSTRIGARTPLKRTWLIALRTHGDGVAAPGHPPHRPRGQRPIADSISRYASGTSAA